MEAGYRLIEHTADAGVEAWGNSPAQAFWQAARGMFAITLGRDPLTLRTQQPSETLDLQVGGGSWPDLLVNFLAELVFHFDVEGLVPLEIDMDDCEPPRCEARLRCVRLGGPEQAEGVGIKAVTYHQLKVEITPGRAEVRVIFDI